MRNAAWSGCVCAMALEANCATLAATSITLAGLVLAPIAQDRASLTTTRMARIFCIANQKGGVGKTTTTVNLAAGLALVGQRVLVVDMDPQGNATMGSGIDKRSLEATVYDVLLETADVAETRHRSPKGGYDV